MPPRALLLVLVPLVLLATACERSSAARCEKFARLSGECTREKADVSASICKNAFDRAGETATPGAPASATEHARYVAWLNATLRLQAECADKARGCDDFERCADLRAPR